MKKKKITKRIFAVFFAVLIILSVFTLGIGAQDCTHSNVTSEWIPPTCTEEGYWFYTCPDCSWSEKNDFEGKLGHTYIDGVCSVCGLECLECTNHTYIDGVCSVCGRECTNHTYIDGVCSVCGTCCTHSNVTSEWIPPTCTEEGYWFYTCPDCSWSEKNDFEGKLGHTYIDGVCSVCGLECTNHTYIDGVCSVCGTFCSHPILTMETIFPTCTEKGYCLLTCPDCSWSEKNDFVDELGHTYIDCVCSVCGRECTNHAPGQSATCTIPQTCIECGEVLALAIGHDFDQGACRLCGVQCAHSKIKYLYTIHEYDENEGYAHKVETCCSICHALLDTDPWVECTFNTTQECICGRILLTCDHDFDQGACRLCGVQCAHSETEYLYTIHEYDENEGYAHKVETCCSICHALLDTDPWVECTFDSTQKCTFCGRACEHLVFVGGYCDGCGEECAHSYYLGSCRYCYKDCKHIFNGDSVRCSVCGYVDYYYIDGDNDLAFDLVVSIYDGMAYVFNSMLDYNIFGINIASLIISLASLAILAFVLKKVL